MSGTGFPVNGTKGELRSVTEEYNPDSAKGALFVTTSHKLEGIKKGRARRPVLG
jgi:hypothetical protein